ncbi:glucuronyl hydrolase [Aquimarina sp. BL5]|uniref:glycoside hydrolase family 88 protein n=1 Tax=Aquimarina sp. BL5 TaxID=1714860 RepID=UPI000E482480|nr:glycoside hydrolase family 88 protein [Aquimarina sp. BL5]AXT51587.1 glucuronyl hydrolase [Aquimarina sp. BL5]RKN09122.1 glucuronyl hydrolase [Aquimarina sp. BL5]
MIKEKRFRPHVFLVILLVFFIGCKNTSSDNKEELIIQQDSVIKYADRFSYLLEYPLDSLAFPRSAGENGSIKKVPSKDWTSGFFAGSLWLIYEITGDDKYSDKAKKWTAFIEKEKNNDRTHDMGFKVFCSFGNGYKITNDESYKSIILESAQTLSTRYNSTIGSIRSWDFNKEEWQFPVIIDNMMNLELLFEASNYSEDSKYYEIAEQHAKTTLKNHFRNNNSSYHVVDYDTITGNIRSKVTHQGFGNESSWARGQAWGLYGFIMAYRYTKNVEFLEQSKKIAGFLMNHINLPEDAIPYWDFDAPNIPSEPRDASAATVIASGLIELYEHTGDKKYLDFSDRIMSNLSSIKYIIQNESNIPFILNHSTGNWPKNDEINGPISYADYYFLEAILRRTSIK